MRTAARRNQTGIALIIVMISITVLSILAAGFAYSMKVETKLAQNSNSETELTWLGLSGVELARYVLAESLKCPYDSLNQKWAGGPGSECETNGTLMGISLENYELGNGRFSVKITDLERKANINGNPNNPESGQLLEQALRLVGVDPGDFSPIANSILDWIDSDDGMRAGGTESEFYESLDPPYRAKNKPIDDLSELLLVRGVTPDIYWGGAATDHQPAAFQNKLGLVRATSAVAYPVGLVDIFTPLSRGGVNINTASVMTLQAIPFIDENIASEIIRLRSGPDGVDGNEDDTPFHNPGEGLLAAGLNPQIVSRVQNYFAQRCRSSTFEVRVDAEIGSYKRQFFAIIGRISNRDIQVLSFYWK